MNTGVGGRYMARLDKKWIVLCSAALGVLYTGGYLATESQASIVTSSSTGAVRVAVGQYADGTYTGSGSNRRGYIQVAVQVKSGKIVDVEITDFGMHYSEDDVVGLPQEVIQNQSPSVQNVSGATYSTEAFQAAVQDALSQAGRV